MLDRIKNKSSLKVSEVPEQTEIEKKSSLTDPPDLIQRVRSEEKARDQIGQLNEKIQSLAPRFASGSINRVQFEELFSYYQNEKQAIEQALIAQAETTAWEKAINEGRSTLTKIGPEASLLGYAVYDHLSSLALAAGGDFKDDTSLFKPILQDFQVSKHELYKAGFQRISVDEGRLLFIIPGSYTTVLALFSDDLTDSQLDSLSQIHKLIEEANTLRFSHTVDYHEPLVCPLEYFLTHNF